MARWTRKYTTAVTNTDRDHQSPSEKSKATWRRRQGNDRLFWLFTLGAFILSSWFWRVGEEELHKEQEGGTASAQAQSDSQPVQSDQSIEKSSSVAPKPSEIDPNQAEGAEGRRDTETSLLWWVDAAPLPSPTDLMACLDRSGQAPVQILSAQEGYSILTPGRTRPQTIFERGEQIWFKTPPLSSAHMQAYDHLALAACLKAPGATLYDPLLVRQWVGDEWPQKNQESGGFPLDSLFLIRSEENAHFTFGLARLGLSELGIISDDASVRVALRQIALVWLLRGQSQTSQVDQVDHAEPFSISGITLALKGGVDDDDWLGPEKVSVIIDSAGQHLSKEQLKLIVESGARVAPKSPEKRQRIKEKRTHRAAKKSKGSKSKRSRSVQKKKKVETERPKLQYR